MNFKFLNKGFLIIAFIFSCASNVIYAQSFALNANGVNFNLAVPSTPISGTVALTTGAKYRINNMATVQSRTLYGILTVVDKPSSLVISNIDDSSTNGANFQPLINRNDNGTSLQFVTFKLEFFDNETNFPVYLSNYYLTGIDVDGYGTNTTSQEAYRLPLNEYTSYTVNNPTQLTVSAQGTDIQFRGRNSTLSGIAFDNTASFYALYSNPKTSVTFKMGSGIAGTETRQFSMRMGTAGGAFTNPNTVTNSTALSRTDLQVVKSVDNNSPLVGDTVVYTLSAVNNSTIAATNVKVADRLPSGLTFVSASSVNYSASTNIWSVGNLLAGASQSITVTATVNSSGSYSNVAGITGDEMESNTSNNQSTAVFALGIDSDSDGISDQNDYDKDNDGILDTEECSSVSVNSTNFNTTSSPGTAVSFSASSADLGYVLDIFTLDNSFNLTVNGQPLIVGNNNEIQFLSNVANSVNNIRFADGTLYGSGTGTGQAQGISQISGNATNPVLRIIIARDGSVSMLGRKQSTDNNLYPLQMYNGSSFNKVFWSGQNNNTLLFNQLVTGTTYMTGNGRGLRLGFCDTDNDGTMDYLDWDSDDDGCPDVLEGGANFLNGASYITGDRLNTQVNTIGVPQFSTPPTGYDNTTGQTVASAQNSDLQDLQCSTAVGCSTDLYISQGLALNIIDTGASPLAFVSQGNAQSQYNAIGINPLDGRIYGILNNTNNLIVVNPDGSTINLGAVTNLPDGVFYTSGEIDNAGNYYVKRNGGNNLLYRINLSTQTATPITLSVSFPTVDFAFNVNDGLLYGVNSNNGRFYSIDPNNGTVTNIGTTYPATATVGTSYGAMFASSTGEIYGANNGGTGNGSVSGFFQFNLTTGERVQLSDSPASGNNDGAHCVTSPITFNGDLAINITDNSFTYSQGTSVVYTVVVSNNGPFGVLGASVSVPLPTGINAADVTYTAVVANGASTEVSGTQTGAISDTVNVPVGGTVTYTLTVNVPFTYTGNLTVGVSVAMPANFSDTDLSNNSATDNNTLAACYKPAATSGGAVLNAPHGITSLSRAGNSTSGSNWPMVRKGAWTVLESKTKGFVVNRLTTDQRNAIPATDLREGMMIYNITDDCLQVNTTGTVAGWACFNTQTCPTN